MTLKIPPREKLVACLAAQQAKIGSMLVWCGVSVLFIYLVVLLEIYKYHYGLWWSVLMCLPLTIVTWKLLSYQPKETRAIIDGIFHWNILTRERQMKKLSRQTTAYFIAVQLSYFVGWRYAGPSFVLGVGLLLYGLGLLFLIQLGRVRETLLNYRHFVEKI